MGWAEWAEIDRDEGVLIVPSTRTKANCEHRVPLYGRAMEIFDVARMFDDGASPLVFTTRGGKPLDEKQLRRLLRKHEIAAVPHGFRFSFRDWAAEETNHPRDVIEAAYARSDLFERRRILMDGWAVYVGAEHRVDEPSRR